MPLNERKPMEYRRFGKTGKELSVITLGGMRYKHGWDEPRDVSPEDTLDQIEKCVHRAFECGINHIETAYGYTKSEHAYGRVLNHRLAIPRKDYYLMTKGAPVTAEETRRLVDAQLKALKTDYFDFYGWHGINNWTMFRQACASGGPVEELLKLKQEGVIHHIGFSTHAPYEIIIKAIETDFFEFVNLHYYYFYQRNLGAISLARAKDMGVFVISPNDKGGRLFYPSEKLKALTAPSTPIQWNARFCLAHPGVHTLSFGMTELPHFDEMMGLFPSSVPLSNPDRGILNEMEKQWLLDPYSGYDGYELQNDPSGINIPEVLRMRSMWKCFDMKGFGEYRYNLFDPAHHWFAGELATESNIEKVDLTLTPSHIPLKEMLREAHQNFYKPSK